MFEFFNHLWDWITGGLYDMLTNFLAFCLEWGVAIWFRTKLQVAMIAWDVASQVMTDLNISQYVNSAIAGLDPEVRGMVYYMHVPEVLNMVGTAGVTKFALRVVGW